MQMLNCTNYLENLRQIGIIKQEKMAPIYVFFLTHNVAFLCMSLRKNLSPKIMGEHKKFTFRTSVFKMCVLNIKKINQPFRSSGFKVFGDKQEGGPQ